MKTIKKLISSVVDLIYPPLCGACSNTLESFEELLCISCISELPPLELFQLSDNLFTDHFRGRVVIDFGGSLFTFHKGGLVQRMMYQLKYRKNRKLAFKLGLLLGMNLKKQKVGQHLLVPVPLHQSKKKERGYNQSEIIATGIAVATKWVLNSQTLIRHKETKSQTRMNRTQRMINVDKVFRLNPDENLIGQRIMLVDDVITTGATLEACAIALAGVKDIRISLCTLAIGF